MSVLLAIGFTLMTFVWIYTYKNHQVTVRKTQRFLKDYDLEQEYLDHLATEKKFDKLANT